MGYDEAFRSNQQLISTLGEGNAHLVWALGLYLEESDSNRLAAEALTDGPNDKKIDFIFLDRDLKRIIFAQGYYATSKKKDAAPANKASDLNTAAAWLFSGDLGKVPKQLGPMVQECREALGEGDVETIDLLYVHNLPESVNVTRELQTAVSHLRKSLGQGSSVVVSGRELGVATIQNLFDAQESHIEVKDEILCPAKIGFEEIGPKWKASVLTVPGTWLYELFQKHGDRLFSANYRGFLGITKRRRINTAIRQTAELRPDDFWAFNNGITLLTMGKKPAKEGTSLAGLSIINGAQTTGSVGSADLARSDLKKVQVLCRIIECSDSQTIGEIVKYNNTQNEITTWDQYSNDPEQNRLDSEFSALGHKYSKKRGFRPKGDEIGIEDVAQPLAAFHGKYQDANRGRNAIFERKGLYNLAFEGKKARHVLFVYTLSRAIDEVRIALKKKSTGGQIIELEETQLGFLRNLRFKYFLISVISHCLETILGRRIDLETIAFSEDASKAKTNTLIALVAHWVPIVHAILALLSSRMRSEDLQHLSKEEFANQIVRDVNGLIYAAKLKFEDFSGNVSDS